MGDAEIDSSAKTRVAAVNPKSRDAESEHDDAIDAKLDAVIAHEVSHVVRRDALTQRLSLLHRAIFWFSPLAWWLDRHLAELAEQASDEAALS